jgi:hypothetical protein
VKAIGAVVVVLFCCVRSVADAWLAEEVLVKVYRGWVTTAAGVYTGVKARAVAAPNVSVLKETLMIVVWTSSQ